MLIDAGASGGEVAAPAAAQVLSAGHGTLRLTRRRPISGIPEGDGDRDEDSAEHRHQAS